ncbi:MAG: 50S ribosomal protein L10 [Candidatus Omnitrophica bacterium]|nr:50S ribosomal protein L10 [Candidatus Omnitrophota bacterium]MDE2213998.1 50S ribosomal protein L10 [Candidatus Omnitrophota bacterium]MDE2231347.1 50S ribosomal protein L10 [Candidatus Omnitrophota bacterium]
MMKVGTLFRQKMAASVKEGVAQRSSTFVVSYRGVSSAKMNVLRKDLKRKKAEVLVSKSSVARIALKEAKCEDLANRVEGQMALILSDADACEVSKVLVKFAKDCEGFVVRGGMLDGAVLTEDQIKTLSDLPPREVLLATLLGLMAAPVSRFAGALNGKTRDLMSILKQKS